MKIKRQVMVQQEEWHFACDVCKKETPKEHLIPDNWFTLYPRIQYFGAISETERDRVEKVICDKCHKKITKQFKGLAINPKADE